MNVLVVTSCYPVEHSPSDGIFVRSQCEALAAAGASVTVLAPRPWVPPGFSPFSEKWDTYRRTPTYYKLNGIPVHRPRYLAPPRSDLWMPVHRQFADAAVRLRGPRPDIVHAHFAYPGGIAAGLLARRWRVPTVLTLHGDDVNTHPDRHPRLRRALLAGVSGAAAVIGVSEALADRTLLLTGRRPAVMPIGINLRTFNPPETREQARRILGLPANRRILLHLGRLVPGKGIPDLLTALDLVKDPSWLGLFVGLGPLAALPAARPDCRVMGVQPNERVPLFLRAADAFVLPSESEGMPTVLVEAGAAGLPVIATPVGGIPELLGDKRGWLVPTGRPDALAAVLRDVMRRPAEAAFRAARLAAYTRDRYDVRRNADELINLYARLSAAAFSRSACT